MGNSSSFYKTLALLRERFPKLALLTYEWSSWPSWKGCSRKRPLKRFCFRDIGNAEAIYVYGLGCGEPYFQLFEWLRGAKGRKLIFLEDDSREFFELFSNLKASRALLTDLQVEIEFLSPRWEELSEICEKQPVQRIECFSIPSKSRSRFDRLRKELFQRATMAYALFSDRIHGYLPLKNFLANLEQLPRSFYANLLQNAFEGIPAIVCGAGPSLEDAIPHLREEKALLIAGGSAIAALSAQGVVPHFGVVIDPNLEEYRRMRNSFAFEMPLLYSTRVFPSVFQTCNGPFGYMRSGVGGMAEFWIEEELGLSEPLIGERFPPGALSVSSSAAAWAQFLGCRPILFAGLDLAYTKGRRYAAGVVEEGSQKLGFAAMKGEKSVADRLLRRKDRDGRWIYTAVRWEIEAKGLSQFVENCPETLFFNTTGGGRRLKNLPFLDLGEALLRYGYRHPLDLRRRVYERIAEAPMPLKTKDTLADRVEALRQSLSRVVSHLEVLAGEREGSKPLAEVELQEELALSVLFYDIGHLCPGPDWKAFLDLARKYEGSFF